MSATADGQRGLAARLGFQPGHVVQEIGWDEDVDEELRSDVEAQTGSELVGADHDDVVDAVLLWWRDDDGDLADALVDALVALDDAGVVWLVTPKVGRPGHVEPSEISDAAATAGLASTSSVNASAEWSGIRLASRRSPRR